MAAKGIQIPAATLTTASKIKRNKNGTNSKSLSECSKAKFAGLNNMFSNIEKKPTKIVYQF